MIAARRHYGGRGTRLQHPVSMRNCALERNTAYPLLLSLKKAVPCRTAVSLSQIIFVLFLVNESLETVRSGQCVLAVHHTAG